MSLPSAPMLGIFIVSLLGLLHQDAAAQPYPAGEAAIQPLTVAEVNGAEEPAVLEPPPELEGFERAKWFYGMVAGPLVDPERQQRLRRAEEQFWRRVEEILAGDYATEEQPDDTEQAHDAVPVARSAEEQDDMPPAVEDGSQQPQPQQQPAPLPADDPLPRAVAEAAELQRKLDEHAATLQELREELEGVKRRLAELIRGRLEASGGQ